MVVFDFTEDVGLVFLQAVVACALGICAGGLAIDHGYHCSEHATGSAGEGPRCRQDAAPGFV